MKKIKRSDILMLLEQWQAGAIDEREVHEQAELWLEQLEDVPNLPEHDPDSILMEVLVQLDALNHQLITSEDIPAIQTFLHTPPGQEQQGWAMWRAYWDNLNLEKRMEAIKSNRYYSSYGSGANTEEN